MTVQMERKQAARAPVQMAKITLDVKSLKVYYATRPEMCAP